MTRFSLFYALLSLLFISSSCTKDVETPILTSEEMEEGIEAYDGVDQALWPYFQAFEEEARDRGFNIDLRASKMTGEITAVEDGAAGLCSYQSHMPNHVTIDIDFWKNASERLKEFVVFHELGHCELGRDHREAADGDGNCLSLMRSGLGTCTDNYRSATRPAYLNELYDLRFRDEI